MTRCSRRRLRELVDADLRPDELERLARVDAVLRAVAGPMRPLEPRARHTGRPTLRLVTPAEAEGRPDELRLGFGELALIYQSLQAAKTLGTRSPQDELLDDTIQLVDAALKRAI